MAQFDREVSRIAAGAGDSGTTLRQADVRALLQQRLRGRPTRSNFRTGTLTVCTMVPMRSVPHRVVCLVGLDDGVFPRVSTVDGDDVLARRPRTGERDLRSEDRQLFLDAITAATERLVITYTGRGEHTGAERPPRRAARRAPRRARPHRGRAGARPRADPPPAPALRRGQLRRRPAARGRRLHVRPLRPRGASTAREDREPVGVLVPSPLPPADAVLGRRLARRPARLPRPPGARLLPPAADRAPLRRRRGQGRDPDHPRRAGEVGRRRPHRQQRDGRRRPAGGDAGRAAERLPAAARPRRRRAHRHRQERQAARRGRPGAAPRAAAHPRRRHRPRRRASALRHGRRRVGQQRRLGVVLQPRRQAPPRRLDRRPRARRRPPDENWTVHTDRQAPLRRAGPADRPARPARGRSSGCATSSRSTTPASASRCRCR